MIVKKKKIAAYIGAWFCIIVWGSTLIATQKLLLEFTPIEILFWRFLIGFAILLIFIPKKMQMKKRKDEWLFFICGITGVTLYFLFQNIALTYTLASNVSIIVCTAPMFTALFANFFLQNEKINHSFVLGFLVSMIGIIVVELNGNFILKLNPFGDLLAILSAIMWGIYCIFINKINEKGYPILLTIRRIFFYGLVTTIPIIILTKTKISVQKIWHPGYLIGLLFLGVLASAFCYAIWNKVTTILGVVKTNAYLYALPVITIILSTIIWKEKLTPFMVVGSLLTIAGLFLSEKKEQTHIEEHEAKELESV